jgi:HTH-type transcriptional regulator/antitoxin HigA
MATEQPSVWQPDWGVPPGEILLESLQDRQMTQSELARRMDRPLKTINEIVKGKAAITPETAIQLERTLGISARVWNGLETNYRESLARQQAQRDLEREAPWVDRFPIKDLVRHGLLTRGRTKAETLASLLSFFRISSPSAWERQWFEPTAAFRSSPAFTASPEAVSAWLRWGEIEAQEIRCRPFNARKLRGALKEIRSLTRREPFSSVVDRVRELCADSGVALVLTPELEGTYLSGAARWITADKALIQLSLRHKSDDHFWFTFFHEAGHLLHSGRRRDFVDVATDDDNVRDDTAEEEEADRFAREMLIPADAYDSFRQAADFSANAVREFARGQGIAAGIVVGRLQRDGHLGPSQLKSLKKPLRWAQGPRAPQGSGGGPLHR